MASDKETKMGSTSTSVSTEEASGSGDTYNAEAVHGESEVAEILLEELIRIGVVSTTEKVYNKMNRRTNRNHFGADSEVKYKKAVRHEENIRQSKDRINREIESVQEELSRMKSPVVPKAHASDVMPGGSYKSGGSRKFQTAKLPNGGTVDIIERVEKDSEKLTKTLKLFNRKHTPLPSINSSENHSE